jgi:TolB-like protein
MRGALEALTIRESETFELLVRGLSNPEIAAILKISPKTVKSHVATLLKKLDVANRTEAAGLFASLRDVSADGATLSRYNLPAIAVLRPHCDDGSAIVRKFGDSVADDVITGLSRRLYPVIARCSSFTLTGAESMDARAIGVQLGARYLIESSLRHCDEGLRCGMRFIDAECAHVLWSERYDRQAVDPFIVLDDICSAIVNDVLLAVTQELGAALVRVAPSPLKAAKSVIGLAASAVCGKLIGSHHE